MYAPNYKDGETVALIRYPHGGTFEIPILTVNNKQAEGKRVLGNTPADAIGINSKVAGRLSGADFDGDIRYGDSLQFFQEQGAHYLYRGFERA